MKEPKRFDLSLPIYVYTHSPIEVCKTLVKYELRNGQAVYERVLCRSVVKH